MPAGVPNGGQFASSTRTEASITLARPEPSAVPAYTGQIARGGLALAICERLVARRHVNGTMTVPARIDDVEVDLRDRFPHIAVRELDERLSRIGKLAEQMSVAEAADAIDTDAYADAADEAGLELAEFPIDPADDDGYGGVSGVSTDCEAFRAAVIEELDDRMQHESSQLAASDARQADQQVTRLPAA